MKKEGKARLKSESTAWLVGRRLRAIRIQKGLTQNGLEKKAGLMRSHISRVENGRRTPSIETLHRLAAALEVPLYTLFCPGPPDSIPSLDADRTASLQDGWRRDRAVRRDNLDDFLSGFRKVLLRLSEADRETVLEVARKLADTSREK